MMNGGILLVKLPYINSNYADYVDLPAGPAVLSETLIFNGIDHEIYDMQINGSLGDFYKNIEDLRPAKIGFSMMTFRYLHNYKLINSAKERFPDIQIIIGGPQATTFREEILKECKGADVVVEMEGEETLVELCSNVPLDKIKGIIYSSTVHVLSCIRRGANRLCRFQ